jgi:hypothetical protein
MEGWVLEGTLGWAVGNVRKLDIRFQNQQNEFQFRKQHVYERPFSLGSLLGLTETTLRLVSCVCDIIAEWDHTDQGSSSWKASDPRLSYFIIQAIAIVTMGLASVATLSRCLKRLSLEMLWASAVVITMLANTIFGPRLLVYFANQQPGDVWRPDHPELQRQLMGQLTSLAFVAIACQLLPLRCCFLGPLAVVAAVCAIVQVLDTDRLFLRMSETTSAKGAAASDTTLCIVLVLTIISLTYSSAHQREKDARAKWLLASKGRMTMEAQVMKGRIKAELVRDLKIMRQANCYMVLPLHEDLRIIGASKRAGDYFGEQVTGKAFTNYIDEPDREKFMELCSSVEGKRIPKSLHLHLLRGSQRLEASVLLLFAGRPGRHFLVGIRTGALDEKGSRCVTGVYLESDEGETEQFLSSHLYSSRNGHSSHPFAPEFTPVLPATIGKGCEGLLLQHRKDQPSDEDDSSVNERVPKKSPSAADSNLSAFDSEKKDSSLSDNFLYSDSSDCCDSASEGVSSLFSGREMQTQTDPMVGMRNASVETDLVWAGSKFRCKCCVKPPLPMGERERAMVVANNLPMRRKRKKSLNQGQLSQQQTSTRTTISDVIMSDLMGSWRILPQFIGVAQTFLHRLVFDGDKCVDASGRRWKVTQDGSHTYLIKGRIWMDGGFLYREGKSGVVMQFQREDEPDLVGIMFDGGDGIDDSQDSVSSMERGHEEFSDLDNLAMLERMVGDAEAQLRNQELMHGHYEEIT